MRNDGVMTVQASALASCSSACRFSCSDILYCGRTTPAVRTLLHTVLHTVLRTVLRTVRFGVLLHFTASFKGGDVSAGRRATKQQQKTAELTVGVSALHNCSSDWERKTVKLLLLLLLLFSLAGDDGCFDASN